MFINFVKRVRQRQGLSQTKCARLIGVSESNLSSVERGAIRPWPKIRRDLASVLSVSESDLFPVEEVSNVSK